MKTVKLLTHTHIGIIPCVTGRTLGDCDNVSYDVFVSALSNEAHCIGDFKKSDNGGRTFFRFVIRLQDCARRSIMQYNPCPQLDQSEKTRQQQQHRQHQMQDYTIISPKQQGNYQTTCNKYESRQVLDGTGLNQTGQVNEKYADL